MKKGNRVRVVAVPELEGNDTFVGMIGTVTGSYPEGAIIDIDEEILDGGKGLFFDYAELEKI